jgi:hypothetical protein
MNIAPGEEEGSYAYSVRVGGKLCLLIGVSIINFPHPWTSRLNPTDGGNSQNAELDSATTSSEAHYVENAPTLRLTHTKKCMNIYTYGHRSGKSLSELVIDLSSIPISPCAS